MNAPSRPPSAPHDTPWWHDAVVYQVYPRSFQDTNGDGVGDLAGVTARADHFKRLGVDAVWVSPFYPSPMKDFGYDVADFTAVDPRFGTMADFDAMAAALRERGLRLLLDFVPAHTSDRHPWFEDSACARDAPRRDWYVWRDPGPEGGPPNNWLSEFGGPAWTFHEGTAQYYFHSFLPSQPSLDWRNPAVRAAMLDAMRFWYDRGVDGFRVDAFEVIVADALFRDNPPNPQWREGMDPARAVLGTRTRHLPEALDVARDMRAAAEEYDPPRLLVGEVYGELDEIVRYYGAQAPDGIADGATDGPVRATPGGFQLPFNFALITAEWTAPALAALVERYESLLPPGAWPNWVLGNHDRARIASRVGRERARLATMLLLTLRGTPTIFQGDELAMENAPIPPDRVRDPWELNVPGRGLGRDPVRTPIPWEAGPGAGFTTGEPWLPIAVPPEGPAAAQEAGDTMLRFTRALLGLRRQETPLRRGSYRTVGSADDVFLYERAHEDRTLRIALNLGRQPRSVPVSGPALLRTHANAPDEATLRPGEGAIFVA